MRIAFLAFHSNDRGAASVHGTAGRAEKVAMLLGDRIANKEAFPREQLVRLPRRIGRRVAQMRGEVNCLTRFLIG